jgi:1-acyl-sn-glycerol-3-phosphate acyltransferase
MLRTAFIAVFLSLYIFVVGPPLLVYTLVTKNVGPLYWAGIRGVMFFVRLVGVRVRVVGTERIPSGTCLFVANHTSSADAPAVVGAIPRRIAILLKESLFKWPIVGAAFTLAHFVPVNRKARESAIVSVERATQAMRDGQSFLIYPEGTRSPDGRLQEFKKGAVVMAIHPGEIVVEFLEPIDAAEYTFAQREELNGRLHAALAAGLPEDQRPAGAEAAETKA